MARALARRRRRARGRRPRRTPSRWPSLATRTAERMALPVGVVAALPPRRLAPRRRQGRDPGADPRQARPARRRRVGADAHASGRRRGASCAASAPLREAAAAVRHHHERYDGTGYPDRLAGEAIPIEARIVAAADAYAAMTADRVYSAARTPGRPRSELRRSAGSHLDPAGRGRAARRARPGRAPARRAWRSPAAPRWAGRREIGELGVVEALDDAVGAGRRQPRGVVAARDRQRHHPGRLRRPDAGLGVLDHEAAGRRDAELRRGRQEQVRRRLAAADVAARDVDLEAQPQQLEDARGVAGRRRGSGAQAGQVGAADEAQRVRERSEGAVVDEARDPLLLARRVGHGAALGVGHAEVLERRLRAAQPRLAGDELGVDLRAERVRAPRGPRP